MDFGLLLLRMTVGLTLAAHGVQKLSTRFGGRGLRKTGEMFGLIGFHPGRRHAFRAGLTEAGGGLLLALGLLTPLAAAIVASVMIVAAGSAHLSRGFFAASGGYEYNLVLGIAGLSLAFIGPGWFSADALLGLAVHGSVWGIAAALIAIAGGLLQLSQRQTAPAAVPAAAA